MIQSEPRVSGSAPRSRFSSFLWIAVASLAAGCDRDQQAANPVQAPPASIVPSSPPPVQTPAPAASSPAPAATPVPSPTPAPKPLSDLESLVAPIALYPDPLLAELLVASTYPLEVVQAARWLETKPDLAGLSQKDWDASVMRIAAVPQVVKMMSDHLDWTTQLGDAFLAKPAEVMDAIQALRKRATDSGFLKDSPEQKVAAKTVSATEPEQTAGGGESTGDTPVKAKPAVLTREVITIEPAKSDTIYVPQYSAETAYQAPLAPPPSGYAAPSTAGYAYPAAAPAPAYYPAYYPTPVDTTTDNLVSFGTGALVGGLLTWGIMEWSHHDDYYHGGYYPVGHYYGGAVCNNGNCWNGGGGYYGDRGNINRNTNISRDRNLNISGNEINVDRGGSFSQSSLRPNQISSGWQPDARHRRGQQYPEGVRQRLGSGQPPALAGQRLGSAQTLPAGSRGFGDSGGRPVTGALPAQRRPSSAEIQQRLAQKPGAGQGLGDKLGARPATREAQGALGPGGRENALAGLRESGQVAQLDRKRGAESRRPASAAGGGQARQPLGGEGRQRQAPGQDRAALADRRGDISQRGEARQGFAGRDSAQQLDRQRRQESSRPSAFNGGMNGGATRDFSQRGAGSRESMASRSSFSRPQGGGARSGGFSGGGGRFQGGGRGGGGRGGGGFRR